MRFFDHQTSARSRSRRLMLAFVLVVLLTLLAPVLLVALAVALWRLLAPGAAATPFQMPWPVVLPYMGLMLLMTLGGWWLEAQAMAKGSVCLARRMGARELHQGRAPSLAEQRLDNIVTEMALAAQMRRPRVMLLPRVDEINAFALGTAAKDWLVVVTQGALTHLTRQELQGMVAHELSHLKEGDTRLNMQLACMVGGLEMVHNYGCWMEEKTGADGLGLMPVWAIGQLFKAVGFVGWLGGRMLQAAVSREREFLADARAVQWARDVDGLGGVLRKAMTQQVTRSVSRANSLSAGDPRWIHMGHLLLVEWEHRAQAHWRERLNSHPTLDERVARLYGEHRDRAPLLPIDEQTGEVRRVVPTPFQQAERA